ncbi:glycosyltransferase WbuB [candidate division KSB1 bacterium]|nr:glycosyltransferase family 4 protein [candidate division KSB1 bacterium]RQW00962.1 MAG: glycosyltransferase WbuB [candidate division KSB1 bacterium]
MLLQSDYPPDIRLAKELKALTKAGFSVHLLCNNKKQRALSEYVEGAVVHRLPGFSCMPASLGVMIRLPLFFSPLWFCYAARLMTKFDIDVLHVHDLPLAPLAILLGKCFNVPVVYDMHENYPAAMDGWRRRGNFWQGIIKNPEIAHLLNNFSLKRARNIIVVVEEQRDHLIAAGVDPLKIYVVGNTVDVDTFSSIPIDSKIIDLYKDNFIILYIGSFSTDRGLQTVIEAMDDIRVDIPQAKLLLVGDGKNKKELINLSVSLNLDRFVEFVGWVDFYKVPSYMHAADINIIPQPSTPSNDTTMPHKLFQYMLVGQPVITSDARPLKRIVEETQCGAVFQSDNALDFSRAVKEIYNSQIDYRDNGKKAVASKYNWQATAVDLIKLYERLFYKRKDIS